LERQPDDRQVVREACDIISRQSRQIARLLDDLLDVSRVMQGKIEMRREILNLAALVPEAVQVARPLIESQGHTLTLDLPPTPVPIQGDAARLLQIQENLLVNAAKYTPRGGKIWVRLTVERDEAVLVVGDNGQGIPPDMVENIFELFVQGPASLARTEGGMGVGLTLVRTLVNKHQGTIEARSSGLGQGSEFIVRLPLAKTDPSAPPNSKESLRPAKNLRIVIVEDNSDARLMLKTLLKMDGHQVQVAGDGVAGVETILKERPDIALVDIGLPGLTGYEVARKVRDQLGQDGVMLVALTGYGRPEDREQVRQSGFDAHIVKPLTLEHLHKVFERFRAEESQQPANA
jgi:two-component system, chemotaxis family, CheB/CheR fusion protein